VLQHGFWLKRRVCVTGGHGFLGRWVCRALEQAGAVPIPVSRRTGHDLRELAAGVRAFQMAESDIVINCASDQGGIAYQKLYPGRIYCDNLLMGANTLEAARRAGVRKYVNIIAGCAYPGDPPDGILRETEFEAGPMHATVDNYGATKRAAVMQAKCYRREFGFNAISLILINLYGPGEHFHPDRSHALAALLRKFYEARQANLSEVTLWGTGRAVREWLYVTDAAEGILRAAEVYAEAEPLNIAVGHGDTIASLAHTIREVVGYQGRIAFDPSKPDGALCKVGDTTRMRALLDWEPPMELRRGIQQTLEWLDTNYKLATT